MKKHEKTTQLRNMFWGVKLDQLVKDWETTMLDQAGRFAKWESTINSVLDRITFCWVVLGCSCDWS